MRINQILVFNSVYSSYLKITVFVNLKLVIHFMKKVSQEFLSHTNLKKHEGPLAQFLC